MCAILTTSYVAGCDILSYVVSQFRKGHIQDVVRGAGDAMLKKWVENLKRGRKKAMRRGNVYIMYSTLAVIGGLYLCAPSLNLLLPYRSMGCSKSKIMSEHAC